MKKDKFHNKDGTLTSYAFMCGYQEVFDHDNKRVRLYVDGCYHVRAHDFTEHKHIAWDTYHYVKDARKRFRELKKQIQSSN